MALHASGGLGPGGVESTFGDTLTAELNPRVSIKAVYGVRSDTETFSATGGSVTASNAEFVIQTGTSAGHGGGRGTGASGAAL